MKVFLHIITNNIVPIFILISIGFILGKKFVLDLNTLSKLNFFAFVPFFSFTVIYSNDLSVNMGRILIFTAVFMLINYAAALAAGAMRKLPPSKKQAFVNANIFYNSGNMGIPLIMLVFQGSPFLNQALIVQITIMLTQTLTTNTLGFFNAGRGNSHWKHSLIDTMKIPVIYAIIAAVVLKRFSLDMENSFIWPAFNYIRQAMIGYVLITLGIQLSQTKLEVHDPDVFISVAMRLIGGPAAALLIIKIAGMDGVLAQTLLISSAMPTAVTTALIAIEKNNESEYAAKTVMYSTIACSITLVFVVYFAQKLFPLI